MHRHRGMGDAIFEMAHRQARIRSRPGLGGVHEGAVAHAEWPEE